MRYDDTVAIATPEGITLEITLAGLGSRFVAMLIDQLIMWTLIIALLVGAGAAGAFGDLGGAAVALAVILIFGVQFGYDVLFETLASGRTPGKRLTGLRVVRADGSPVGFLTAAVRNLLRAVDVLPGMYTVGMIAILATPRNQRVGDMAAGTLVVRERTGGGRTVPDVAPSPAPLDDTTWLGWDVSAVTAQEVVAVRKFLGRRDALERDARVRIAGELAARLRPKVVAQRHLGDEAFLEAVVAAKGARA